MPISMQTAAAFNEELRAITRLRRSLTHRARNFFLDGPGDVTRAPTSVLMLLAERGECRLSEIAEHACVDVSVMSRHVAALERDGLVCRRDDPADRRAALLSLTDAGMTYARRISAQMASWLHDALHNWTEAEGATAAALLARLTHDLNAAATSGDAAPVLERTP